MKNAKYILMVAVSGLISVVLSSCESTPKVTSQGDILPKTMSVAIPSSISSNQGVSGGRVKGSEADTLSGNQIYQNLNTFIAVGAGASVIVDDFIEGIRKYNIDRIISLTYVSDDDQRTKNLVVSSGVVFEGQTWDYELTIDDAGSEGAADGGRALQIFWNKAAAIKGIAIIKPYNCDRIRNATSPDAVFRIDYSESDATYDATMEVQIAGLTLGDPVTDPFSMSSLHMFVGKKGDNIDVEGNSNHPNAVLFTGSTGFDWAFVASSSTAKNIAVAEVGLPPSSLDNSSRNVLLDDYSIRNVFTTGINAAFPGIDPALVAGYLKNTSAPGYFNGSAGFLAAGVSPGKDWDALAARLSALAPYDPLKTNNLVLTFK